MSSKFIISETPAQFIFITQAHGGNPKPGLELLEMLVAREPCSQTRNLFRFAVEKVAGIGFDDERTPKDLDTATAFLPATAEPGILRKLKEYFQDCCPPMLVTGQ